MAKTIKAELMRLIEPGTMCVRATNNSGHYGLVSLSEVAMGVQATLVHLSDSYLPGMGVVGVSTETLVRCGCGGRPAEEDEVLRTEAIITTQIEGGRIRALADGKDLDTLGPDERRHYIFGAP